MRQMPPEWGPHARTWMCFPRSTYDAPIPLDQARSAWGAVALATALFEPVTMVVDPRDVADAQSLFGSSVTLLEQPLDDAWARDIGPTFVIDDGALVAVDWTFNGWGAQWWAAYNHDRAVGAAIGRSANATVVPVDLVNEGGGIETNGDGLIVLTESVQLDPGRNPGWDRAQVEATIHDALGTTRAVWLPTGLAGDYGDYSTRGHVDLVVKFVDSATALVHDQRNPEHPDASIFATVAPLLEAAGITAIPLVGPSRLEVDGRICDWSYVNCYPVNGGLIVGTYDDPADDAALAILADAFPGRTVTPVDARTLFALGGGVHCITQQEPLVEAPCAP